MKFPLPYHCLIFFCVVLTRLSLEHFHFHVIGVRGAEKFGHCQNIMTVAALPLILKPGLNKFNSRQWHGALAKKVLRLREEGSSHEDLNVFLKKTCH